MPHFRLTGSKYFQLRNTIDQKKKINFPTMSLLFVIIFYINLSNASLLNPTNLEYLNEFKLFINEEFFDSINYKTYSDNFDNWSK